VRNIRILKNSRDLFEKLKYDRSQFKENVQPYDFFNFVVTGYHLFEWIKEEPGLSKAAVNDLSLIWDADEFQVSRDIANGNKHFREKPGSVKEVEQKTKGYGTREYGRSPYGEAEESFDIHLQDGRVIGPRELALKLEKLYQDFFDKHIQE